MVTGHDGPKLRRRLLPFEKNFTQIPNRWMRDESISWKARGLLAMLLTHDDGFSVTLRAITNASPQVLGEGLDGMRSAVNELEAHGYLRRHPISRGGRFLGDDWELCDPTGVHDPTLFGLVDNTTASASAQTTRKKTASAQTTRTASAQTTPIRTPVKNNRAAPQGARPSLPEEALDLLKTCPRGPSGRHEFDGPGSWCRWCAQVREDGSVYDRHGEPLAPPIPTTTTSKEDGHAVAS